jgi:alpha-glucoside transport system substrate-binding protein
VAAVVAAVAAVVAATTLASCSSRPVRSSSVVTVFGTLSDADVDDFMASVTDFESSTGIDVRYVGSSNFEADLLERLRRGDPPDLALLPQPGLLDTLVEDGFALPWDGELAEPAVAGVPDELVDLAEFGGDAYGAWYQLTLKSLVWYSPRVFAERGLDVPSTWDELTSMTGALAAGGTTPWCIGIRADGATGWVATDWVEDMVLRFAGPDVYDGWVTHEVPFTDDAIVDAVERFGAIALSPPLVAGGNRAAVELTIDESARELLQQPTRCVLHRQASFLPRLVGTSGLTVAPDGDLWAFPMPAVDGGRAPLVVGGTVAARFSDDDDVVQLARYLTTDEAATRRAARGGFVSPRSSVTLDRYSSMLDRFVAELLMEADVVRFDASDLMPPEVGVGTFWTGMTSWLGGARLRSVLADIDASWPVALTKPAIPFDAGGTDD